MLRRLQKLDKSQLELAMQVVWKAWQNAESEKVTLELPDELKQLNRKDWEAVCQLLLALQHEQRSRPLN